jgi:hypothetical protein
MPFGKLPYWGLGLLASGKRERRGAGAHFLEGLASSRPIRVNVAAFLAVKTIMFLHCTNFLISPSY